MHFLFALVFCEKGHGIKIAQGVYVETAHVQTRKKSKDYGLRKCLRTHSTKKYEKVRKSMKKYEKV